MNEFNERLKIAMNLKKISQSELCELTGIPKSAMSQYVSGAFAPKQERTYLIAKALNVNEAWLLGYDDVSMDRAEPKLKKIPYNAEGMELIPLVGKVAAGYNCHAEENITEYIRTDADSLKTGYDYFWLEVKGDSMEPTIQEGDLVLVQEQDTLDSDCFAVVIVDNEDGLVKKVSIDSGKVVLFSINPYYPPRTFEKEDMNRIRIVGKVVEVKRRLV